jgi:hypothetical protein
LTRPYRAAVRHRCLRSRATSRGPARDRRGGAAAAFRRRPETAHRHLELAEDGAP